MKLLFISKPTLLPVLWLTIILGLLIAGCAGSQTNTAPATTQAYINALVSKDATMLTSLSCAAWEADAKTELDSFGAVTARLEDLSCKEAGKDGNFTLVACTGKIIANYNGEDQTINLADRTYKMVQEGGDWRMCGYR
jgi:hypothetical protein